MVDAAHGIFICASRGALAGKGKPVILYRLAHLWRHTVAPNYHMIVT